MGGSGSKASATLKYVTLWKTDRSPSCRAVMMALDAMNLSVNEVDVNMDRGEHRTAEMLKKNSFQTLPVLQDRALILRDRFDNTIDYTMHNDAILYESSNLVKPQQVYNIECAYADMDRMLDGRQWFGGSWITLADICLAATTSTLHCLVPVDSLKYPRLSSWFFRISEEPFYITGNKKGLAEFVQRIGELSITEKY